MNADEKQKDSLCLLSICVYPRLSAAIYSFGVLNWPGAKVSAVVYDRSMKARVFVSPKTTVLDPQGQTIRGALHGLGHRSIADVRQGKFFEIEINGDRDAA